MRPATLTLLTLLALPATAPHAQTADPQTVTERLPACLACHGQNGASATENVPSLGAMPVNYVLTQLYLFREKIRVAEPMNAMAAGLTDDDIRSLAAIFNKMPPPPLAPELSEAERTAGQALIEQHHCNSCHGPALAGQQTIPHIAGQREEYVRQALIDYKSNVRKGYSPAMNEASQEIKAEDIPLLAKYVASFR